MFSFSSTPTEKYFFTVFVLSCALMAIFTAAIYRQSQLSLERDQFVIESYETLRQARLALIYALNLETGQRGYLLSNETEFLMPYNASLKELDQQVVRVAELIENNERQKENLLFLDKNIKTLEQVLAEQIKIYRRGNRRGLNKIELERGKIAMEDVRSTINQIIITEQETLNERIAIAKNQQRNYLITLFTGALLALGGLFVANMVIYSLLNRNKDTRQALYDTEERYKTVMNGINDGVYDYDAREDTIYLSPSYKMMLGYDDNEYPNSLKMTLSLLHPDDKERALHDLERYKRREVPTYYSEFRMRHKDGGWRWILSRGIGIWDPKTDELIRVIGAHTDITMQKEREEELMQLNADLESFTYIASHDLRAPLVNIKGFSGEISYSLEKIQKVLNELKPALSPQNKAVIEESLNNDIPESLNFIDKAVHKMDKLTGAILDLSRIGRREYNIETVDANQVVKRCLDVLSYEISKKNVNVEVGDLPEVYTDNLALEQVFGNILDNAVKYLSPERRGHIRITSKHIPYGVLFSIEDNGRGIADGDHRKVFDVFRRADNSNDVRGLGMGMAYVKAMLRKLGGKIWFESILDRGTVFYFTLPIKEQKVANE